MKKIGIKHIDFLFIFIYLAGIIPLLVIGNYNWPSADDFSMARQPHETFADTGNLWLTFLSACSKTVYVYFNWVGYFFSDFMSMLNPSIFKEEYSAATPYIIIIMLTFGACFFFHALLCRVYGANIHYAVCVSMASLFMIIQCMKEKSRVEAFYWYSGAINYMFMFGLALLWLGILIKILYGKQSKIRFALAVVLGFLLGGANYMTALSLAIISVLIIFIVFLVKRNIMKVTGIDDEKDKDIAPICIPAAFNLIGFVISIAAPGNVIRSANTQGVGAIEAILMSMYGTFEICINELLRWEVVFIFGILAVIFWNFAGKVSYSFEHPIIYTVFSFLIVSANMTPPIYAMGNIDTGRIYSLVWAQFIIAAVLCELYVISWFRKNILVNGKNSNSMSFSKASIEAISFLLVFIVVRSVACIDSNYNYYSFSSAVHDLRMGTAKAYRDECVARLEILKDPRNKTVVFEEYSAKPQLLFFEDIYTDENEWINTVVARYYNKDTVRLKATK